MDHDLQQLTLPAGTAIRLNGMPFVLENDTPVLGREENLQVALDPVFAVVSEASPG
jgi:hypothetical protein